MAQDNEIKRPYQMATPENTAGAESSQTSLIGTPVGVDLEATFGINGTYDAANRSAKFKAPSVSQDQGAGANQY